MLQWLMLHVDAAMVDAAMVDATVDTMIDAMVDAMPEVAHPSVKNISSKACYGTVLLS